MSCICFRNLTDLLKSLIPVVQLNLKIPLVVPKIAAITEALTAGGAAPAPASMMSADAALTLALSLPRLPISLHLVQQITATLQAAEQIAATFGLDSYSQAAMSQLQLTINTLAINLSLSLPKFAFDTPKLLAALDLSSTMAAAARFQAMFGIDLYAPTAAAQIRARLRACIKLGDTAAAAPAMMTAAMSANLAAYAQLAAALQMTGGLMNLLPKLNLLASIKFPQISLKLFNDMATVMALQQSMMNLQTMFSLNPLDMNLALALKAQLQPLLFLETFELDGDFGSAAAPGSWFPVDLSVQASLIAQMNLSALLALKLPSLAPLSLAAQFVAGSNAMQTSSCDPSCPAYVRI
jgi:hypothetical protein